MHGRDVQSNQEVLAPRLATHNRVVVGPEANQGSKWHWNGRCGIGVGSRLFHVKPVGISEVLQVVGDLAHHAAAGDGRQLRHAIVEPVVRDGARQGYPFRAVAGLAQPAR